MCVGCPGLRACSRTHCPLTHTCKPPSAFPPPGIHPLQIHFVNFSPKDNSQLEGLLGRYFPPPTTAWLLREMADNRQKGLAVTKAYSYPDLRWAGGRVGGCRRCRHEYKPQCSKHVRVAELRLVLARCCEGSHTFLTAPSPLPPPFPRPRLQQPGGGGAGGAARRAGAAGAAGGLQLPPARPPGQPSLLGARGRKPRPAAPPPAAAEPGSGPVVAVAPAVAVHFTERQKPTLKFRSAAHR
jgi:hypothetical protein